MHRRIVWIDPTDAAVATPQRLDARGAEKVVVLATGLATSEVFTFFAYDAEADDWQALYDDTGAALQLTATDTAMTLEGGLIYGATKSASAGDAGLEANLRRGS